MKRALFLSLLLTTAAWAHDPGLSSLEIVLEPAAIEARLSINVDDLAAVVRSGGTPELTHIVELQADERAIDSIHIAQENEDAVSRRFVVRFPRPRANRLAIRCSIFDELPHGHRQLLSVKNADGKLLVSRLLTRESGWVELPADSEPPEAKPVQADVVFPNFSRYALVLIPLVLLAAFWIFR